MPSGIPEAGASTLVEAETTHEGHLRSAVLWSVLSLLLFLAAEECIFRWGIYRPWIEPNSTTGTLEAQLYWLKHNPKGAKPEVMVVGDSRIAEGFSARVADKAVDGSLHFWNAGMAGTGPRVWFYFLRDADPTRQRFSTIVLALAPYSDEDHETFQDRRMDLNYSLERLQPWQCPTFVASYLDQTLHRDLLRDCVFAGVALRTDLQEFLRGPLDRAKRATDWLRNGYGYISDYTGKDESVTGLTADIPARKINFPPGLNDGQKSSIESTVLPPPAPQTGVTTRFREHWLGQIVDLYKNTPVRIVFAEVPRAPLPLPPNPVPPRAMQALAKRPHVTVLPDDTFHDLERPEVFADGLHLNKFGRPIFSERLGKTVAGLMGGGGK